MSFAAAALAATTSPDAPPAAGAELAQVIGASTVGALLTVVLLWLGMGHRSGRVHVLEELGAFAEKQTGLPPWAALPAGVAGGSLLVAVLGMYWDISLHIDDGRDPGPLANPSHYLILFGLFGLFSAGWLALTMPKEKPGAAAVKITRDWYAPVGGLVLMGCGAFALAGFPLDDVSHRLFGQDVTLWGPTHLMLIGGAGLSLFGVLILLAEGRQVRKAEGGTAAPALPARWAALSVQVRTISACGGLLIGMSVYQGEFDFGVPQFRLLYQPVLIALATGVALTAARVMAGRGAALGAVAFFLLVRGALAVIVGGVFGQTTPHFPLYVVEALVVEGVALWLGTRRALRFGVVSGLGIGAIGLLAGHGWTHVWMPLAWPAHMLPETLALGTVVAVASGLLGAFAGTALLRRPELAASPPARCAALVSLAVLIAVAAILAPTRGTDGVSIRTTLQPVAGSGGSEVTATVRPSDPSAAQDAEWFTALAWQGEENLVNEPLEQVSPGVWRSGPIPVTGSWKAMIRLQKGGVLASAPVFLPEDRAIPAAGVPASASFTRELVPDHETLQRERKDDVPGWLWAAAYLVVGFFFAALIALLSWSLVRIARDGGDGVAPPWTASGAERRVVVTTPAGARA